MFETMFCDNCKTDRQHVEFKREVDAQGHVYATFWQCTECKSDRVG